MVIAMPTIESGRLYRMSPNSESNAEPLNLSNPQILLSTLKELRQTVEKEGQATFNQWRSQIQRSEFIPSALNLAQYLALRRHDLRLSL